LQGVNATALSIKGIAFNLEGGVLVDTDVTASDTIRRDVITTTADYAYNMKAFADFDFSGWGAYVQFNFAMERDIKFKSNQQLFIAWRKIVQGYVGYKYPPGFTDVAKEIL